MSKTSNIQKIEVLKVWLDDLKRNSKIRKHQHKKTSKWIEEIEHEN